MFELLNLVYQSNWLFAAYTAGVSYKLHKNTANSLVTIESLLLAILCSFGGKVMLAMVFGGLGGLFQQLQHSLFDAHKLAIVVAC